MAELDKRAERFIKRYDKLMEDSSSHRSEWQKLADYIQPNKNQITKQRARGAKTTQELMEGTSIRACNSLASFIAGTLTNMAVKFFTLTVDDEIVKKDTASSLWLESTSQKTLSWLRRSNFGTESQELYRELGAFGTGAILFDERIRTQANRFGGYMFRSLPIGGYVIAENPEGFVDTMYTKMKLSPVQMAQRWGKDALSEAAGKKLNTNSQDDQREVIHAVEPNVSWRGGLLKSNKAWASIFIDLDAKHIISQGGYHEFPAMVPRWAKMSGETYGRGPGHDAYPDIRSLNKAMEFMFRAWAKAIDPPINVLDDSVVGNVINQIPSGVNVVRDLNAIQPWQSQTRFEQNQQIIPDLRLAILETFFVDKFQLPNKTIITATEVERRLELMQQILGPVVGRLETEYLAPLIERAFRVLYRANMLDPIPDALLRYAQLRGGLEISIKYEGPLARSQRQNDLAAVQRFLEMAAPVVTVYPDAIDVMKWDEFIMFIGELTSIPKQLLNSVNEIKRIRAKREAERAQLMQQQQINQGADTAQKLGAAAAAFGSSQDTGAPVAEGRPEAQ